MHRRGATNATTHADTDCRNPEYRGAGSANATTQDLAFLTGRGSGCFDYDCSETAGVTNGVGDKYLHLHYLTGYWRVKKKCPKTPEIAQNWRHFSAIPRKATLLITYSEIIDAALLRSAVIAVRISFSHVLNTRDTIARAALGYFPRALCHGRWA